MLKKPLVKNNNHKARILFPVVFICACSAELYGQSHEEPAVPLAAGLLIETGLDWKWRNIAYTNTWLAEFGKPGFYISYIVPETVPLIMYTAGRILKDKKLQLAGLALTQSLFLTLAVQVSLKVITGRAKPGIIDEFDHIRSSRTDNFSGEFDWFNMNFIDGWPSGHTANAFAAAATLGELYPENRLLKAAVYSYAAVIGFGLTLNVHWASEILAGALIGYAIGKTVGRSFSAAPDNVKPSPAGLVVNVAKKEIYIEIKF
ncbi:MAG: phosphatase PAP2 family protein [Treponema sp.]|nr:phosphatase PAP2 family protein [Treponema sp.]